MRNSYTDYEKSKGWRDERFAQLSSDESAYFDGELAALGLLQRSQLRVLEIGFGNGQFLGWLRDKRWEAVGVELNAELVERARRHGFSAAQDLTEAGSDRAPFDLIAAFDVLEHVERDDLVGLLVELRKVSHADTLMLFRFPNGDNPFALPFQNGDVTHRTSIGSGMIRQLAALGGLDVVFVGPASVPWRGRGLPRQLSLLIGLPVRAVLGFLIRHVFMGGVRVSFSGNLVAVLKPGRVA